MSEGIFHSEIAIRRHFLQTNALFVFYIYSNVSENMLEIYPANHEFEIDIREGVKKNDFFREAIN